jgi:hypothetical protein
MGIAYYEKLLPAEDGTDEVVARSSLLGKMARRVAGKSASIVALARILRIIAR